ncbi:MAG: hypothetical protein KF860_17155 [Cyclobacteriaceae bacterium]|nr:hypothetical protein [Cyclobacteriaceae bacterium]
MRNFLYEFRDQKILHFTNLNSAYAILKSQKLRSSNLSSFASNGGDNEELTHALRLTNNFKGDYLTLKDHIFVSCFTPLENRELESFIFHWENYGDNYQGVAFEFEILRSYSDDFFLQVKYLNEIPEKEEMLQLLQNNPISEQAVIAFSPLLAAIKMTRYADEKEVRLVTIVGPDDYKSDHIRGHYEIELDEDLNIKKRIYYIPFCTQKSSPDRILLKLHKIHLGEYSSNNSGAVFIRDFLRPLAEEMGIDLSQL